MRGAQSPDGCVMCPVSTSCGTHTQGKILEVQVRSQKQRYFCEVRMMRSAVTEATLNANIMHSNYSQKAISKYIWWGIFKVEFGALCQVKSF